MAKNRPNVRGARKSSALVVDDGKSLFSRGTGGRWATAQLKAAVLAGQALSASCLRTLDTLRHEEWKFFDDALVTEALIRLVGVADLVQAGLTRPVPNALGKTVFGYEKITFMDEATVSLDGISRGDNDRQEFSMAQLPLPITHKDFFINLRTLSASREKGEPLDTTQAATAGRVVAEMAEKMLFQGSKTFGGLPIYGYTTFPQRITSVTFDGGKDWSDTSKLGSSFLKDVTNALTTASESRQYGPFYIYVPTDAGVNIENDYNAGTANTQSIRQRVEAVAQIKGIHVADQLPSGQILFVQMTSDNVVWVQGDSLQTVQWDEYGGFELNFKAFQIAVPLIRSDAAGRSGIVHVT
jgi:uncharacterized linocin/CFP29 family protein